jgi:uncharacterized protein YjdB
VLKRFVQYRVLLPAIAVVAACAPTSPRPSVSEVLMAPSSATISVGQSVRIVATVSTSPGGSAYTLTWTTSDATAANVDSTGLAVGVSSSPGVSICATARTGSASSNVRSCSTLTVSPALLCPGPGGVLIPSADTMHVGDVAQFQIPAAQASGRIPGQIRWSVDNPAPASVDSLTGVVTAVSAGTTNVRAVYLPLSPPCPHEWRAAIVVH